MRSMRFTVIGWLTRIGVVLNTRETRYRTRRAVRTGPIADRLRARHTRTRYTITLLLRADTQCYT